MAVGTWQSCGSTLPFVPAARSAERLACRAPDCRGFDRFAADHNQTREHREPKGETSQDEGSGETRLEASAHEVKQPGAGSLKGAKTERDRRKGGYHGRKYEAHKGASDVYAQADGPARTPKGRGIEEEDAELQSYDFEDELRIAQHIDANLAEHLRQSSEWPPTLDPSGNEGVSRPRQEQKCHPQTRDNDREGDEQRSPSGVQVAAVPKHDESKQADQEIGGVIGNCSDEERRDGDRGSNPAAHQAAYDHEAATEPTGGDRLIGEKLNERKPEETHEWQRRPGPIEDAKPDSGCADIGR